MKKRAAPPPPTQNNNNSPATPCHSRTPSDPGLSQSPSGAIHRRNHSTDLISCSSHSINHTGSSTSDFSINGNNLRFQTASVTLGRIVIAFLSAHCGLISINNPGTKVINCLGVTAYYFFKYISLLDVSIRFFFAFLFQHFLILVLLVFKNL